MVRKTTVGGRKKDSRSTDPGTPSRFKRDPTMKPKLLKKSESRD
jgi:hypothetical protein